MSEVNTNKENRQEQGKNILIVVLVILVLLSGVRLFFDHKEKTLKSEEILILTEETSSLNSRIDSMTFQLDLRIKEIERLGGEVDSLVMIKDELIKERNSERTRSASEIARLNRQMDGYGEMLREKDEDIVRLRELNDQLYAENKDLKSSKAEVEEEVVKLNRKAQELEEKVNVAARLRAENIVIAAVNARGRERVGEFRNRQLEKLKISFNLGENSVAPLGAKDIYVQVLGPNEQVIFDIAKGSGTFNLNGREEFFTSKQDIIFDNTLQKLTYYYEKGSDYAKGSYMVKVFSDGIEIGNGSFEVK
ncbi:hypothetical protein [Pleomorphovibrio marinus]|uniref:hypothetical protein n=1 Tax=Pleomorphovibrio marinus TaxID=2164132 RepID=UPI000E0C704C|nr:hypothetical protein [Pleomorphovibrio marinus]